MGTAGDYMTTEGHTGGIIAVPERQETTIYKIVLSHMPNINNPTMFHSTHLKLIGLMLDEINDVINKP